MDGLINEFLDLAALQKQAGSFEAMLINLENRLNALKASKGEVNLSVNTGDIVTGTKAAQQALANFTLTSRELTAQAKLQTEETKRAALALSAEAKAATEAQKQELLRAKAMAEAAKARGVQADIDLKFQKQNDQTVKQIVKEEKEVEKLSNDYLVLSKAYTEAALRAKNLSLIAPGSQTAKDAAAEANKLADVLKKVDASVGQNQRNVGGYTEAITGAFSKVFGYFRTAANIIPGLGLSGLFLGIYEGIQLISQSGGLEALVHNLFNIKDAYTELVDKRNLLNEVQAEANKNAAKEIIDARILYQAATDLTLPIDERRRAVVALKKEFPDYFKGISTETILNGDAKKSYDELVLSIEKTARATAAKGKLDEIEAKRLDIEFQKQKIRNAVAQEQANAKDKNLGQEGGGFEKGTGTKSVIYTAAEQKADAERRKKRALDEQNDADARLKRQEDFLIKFAGGENEIAKTIENKELKTAREKQAKNEKDYYLEALKAQQEAKKAMLDVQKDLYDSIEKDDKQGYLIRLGALKSYLEIEYELLENDRKFALAINEEKTQDELKKANLTAKQRADIVRAGQDEAIKIQAEFAQKLSKARLDGIKEEEKLTIEEGKRLLATAEKTLLEKQRMEAEARAKGKEDDLKFLDEVGQLKINRTTRELNDEQAALLKSYSEGKLNKEEYERGLLKIQRKYGILQLELQLEIAKAQEQKLEPGDPKYDAVVTNISNIEAALRKLRGESSKDSKDQFLKDLEFIKQTADAVASSLQGIIDGGYERQKQAIQKQIDLVDEQKAKELAANDATAQSAQDKANNIAIIEARAQAKKEELQKRQREIDNRKAKADRAFQIFSVIGNTAMAVSKAVAESPLTFGLPFSAVAAAIGALQIAAILAQPLPAYKKGKNKDSYSGPAIWGDGGKPEMKISEDGTIEISPSTPTLTHVKANDIILPDAEAAMKAYNIASINTSLKAAGKTVNEATFDRMYVKVMEDKLSQTNAELRAVKEAVKTIKTQHIHLDANGFRKWTEDGTNQTEWINRMFRT